MNRSEKGNPGILAAGAREMRRSGSTETCRGSARGEVRIGTLFGLIILAIIGYGAYKLIPPYVRYTQVKYMLKEQAARAKIDSEARIRRKTWQRLEGMDAIYLDEDDLHISINKGKITIEAEYEEIIDLMGLYEYSLYFNPSVTAAIQKKDFY